MQALSDRLFPRLGLRGRFTLYATLLTSALVLVLTAQSYFTARALVRERADQQLQHATEMIAAHLEQGLSIASREVAALATQPLFANALLDSEGREAYLRPFIAQHALPIKMDYNLLLVDYRGEPVIARSAMTRLGGAAWVASVVEEGLPYAGLERRGADLFLYVAVPVYYRYTGTYEGVIVFEANLSAWLEHVEFPLSDANAMVSRVELRSAGAALAERVWRVAEREKSAVAQVDPELPMPLNLSVRVSVDEGLLEAPLGPLLWRHLGWGALLVVLAAGASAVLARALTRRIEALAQAASEVAVVDRPSGEPLERWSARNFGDDEIGALAQRLFRMFGELRTHQGKLEALVADRTAELAAREADLNRAQSIAGIGSWALNPANALLEVSPEMRRLCGVPEGQPFWLRDLLALTHPAERDAVERAWKGLEAGQGLDLEHRLCLGGSVRWVHVRAETFIDAAGRLERAVGTLQDVTVRHQAQARMREALAVFEASTQGIMTTDGEGVIVSANPAFCRITGYSIEEVIGRRPSLLRSGRHDEVFYRALWDTLTRVGVWEGEIWNRRKNGEIYPQWLTISAVRDEGGAINEYVALFSDISERKEQEALIWRQANFDALTGLANRSLLHDRMAHALAQAARAGQRVGLLFIDLDGFKWVNDTLGHDAGDTLLVEVARRLKGCVREQDTVARLGGDEFTVVVTGLQDSDVLSAIGYKILAVLRDPFTLAGSPYGLSGSVGITVYPDDGDDVLTLLRTADIAMYKSKHAGKNRLCFYAPEMQEDVAAHLRMEAELRQAVQQERFALMYQPIVDAASGELVGAEALVRWQHPQRGLVGPAEFIPAAEECGLIGEIGDWVLRTAVRQWRAWRDAHGRSLQLAVNLSGLQFREVDLPERLAALLETHAVEPGALTLEICESALIDGSEQASAAIAQIDSLGVVYALDDFGTGFSSLSYLRRFPVDVVKIDRSFVRDCPDDRNDAHLVEAIINMAHSLGLKVTAEGVETEAQVAFLRELGCDHLQGYLIGRPMPPEAFGALFGRSRLLAPAPERASDDERGRLLEALAEDDLDIGAWLQRVLGAASESLEGYAQARGWVIDGLDLEQAVRSHHDWRRHFGACIAGAVPCEALDPDCVASPFDCPLGRWIAANLDRGGRTLQRLDLAHREFHRLAGQIVRDYNLGYTDSARRLLGGPKFRAASCEVVVALLDCYREVCAEPAV